MKNQFSLIICTYQRPHPLLKLLKSVTDQTIYPDQIIIIDGSEGDETMKVLKDNHFENLHYFKVTEKDRGLTKQRNIGLEQVSTSSDIICFLDDDVVLTPIYFEKLINTYSRYPGALGVGGYIIDDVKWEHVRDDIPNKLVHFTIDGYRRIDSSRFVMRKMLGLMPKTFPTYMPPGGHGRSVGFLPPSGKTYKVETFMGGVSSYRKEAFDKIRFSTFFEGYGLYEDTDFTLRLSKIGDLYVNTSAQLFHNHEKDGRPNQMKYGIMVVRNGWYVWRIKYPTPTFTSKMRWNAVTGLLILIRVTNILNTPNRKQALTESFGRMWGWISLIFYKPK